MKKLTGHGGFKNNLQLNSLAFYTIFKFLNKNCNDTMWIEIVGSHIMLQRYLHLKNHWAYKTNRFNQLDLRNSLGLNCCTFRYWWVAQFLLSMFGGIKMVIYNNLSFSRFSSLQWISIISTTVAVILKGELTKKHSTISFTALNKSYYKEILY